jgi:hypothetical protein
MSTYVMTQIRIPGTPQAELLDYMERCDARAGDEAPAARDARSPHW